MLTTKQYKFWFLTGSQDLYGDACLKVVAEHSHKIVDALNASGALGYELVWKPTLIDSVSIRETLAAANADPDVAGCIVWMHTFSPAKMWIRGFNEYRKPLLHLHTQFNRDIPFDTIDMDFMNENQSAHGDREFAHMLTRMKTPRKIVSGHWSDPNVQKRIADWMNVAIGALESRYLRIVRVGDNMRDVAVTEGDKVEAEQKFGWEVDAYCITDVAEYVNDVALGDINALTDEYYDTYDLITDGRDADEFRRHVAEQAKIEIGFRKFCEENRYQAVVTNFQSLAGLNQLPGLAMQRMMADGYGFGAEGDWKTAGVVRLFKLMTAGKTGKKGTSFMEDYTYHLEPGSKAILQSHMLEVCPSIAEAKPAIRVCPLSMGNREDPARLVFTAKEGDGVACSLVDLGTRFRMIINEVAVKKQVTPMPKLPVATALWAPKPDFETGTEGWLMCGGAHHTAFTYDLTSSDVVDLCDHFGIESVVIGEGTTMGSLKRDLMIGEVYYK
ncbi:MAG: L-arabinose isomerase [Firmicutes bacterium]|nr:L-arabinose isomerase [Bacillota bacterium]